MYTLMFHASAFDGHEQIFALFPCDRTSPINARSWTPNVSCGIHTVSFDLRGPQCFSVREIEPLIIRASLLGLVFNRK